LKWLGFQDKSLILLSLTHRSVTPDGCNLRNCPRDLLIENQMICREGILREWVIDRY